MHMPARGFLAGALASVFMTIAPSMSPAQNVNGKVSSPSSSSIVEPRAGQSQQDRELEEKILKRQDLVTKVSDISEKYQGIVIGISKGQKEKITAEQIGDKLVQLARDVHEAPAQYVVDKGGDYTAIIFAVKGHLYGPYSLTQSLGDISLAADNYDEKVRLGVFSKPDPQSTHSVSNSFLGKPELQH